MSPTDRRTTHDPGAHVAILLGCWQGERWLAEQLDSIERQSHGDWAVWASDDGSTDRTIEILERYRARWGGERLCVVRGPSKGFQANFLSMICNRAIEADYYAYSDQDDIWLPDKLTRSIEALRSLDPTLAAVYGARTQMIDEHGHATDKSWLFTRQPSFRNALVQSLAGGNTMTLNRPAVELLRRAGASVSIVNHDWWTYLLVTGAGGRMIYDPQPNVLYRQHTSNAVGANLGTAARFTRATQVIRGRLRGWNDVNLAALESCIDCLDGDSRDALAEYQRARQGSLFKRARHLYRSGVYRQHFSGNAGLLTALLFDAL